MRPARFYVCRAEPLVFEYKISAKALSFFRKNSMIYLFKIILGGFTMTTTEAIRERRSIRKYKPGAEITQEQIELLLEAAMMAPSACHTRPWEFIVVRNREKLNAITAVHPHTKMLETASLAIVVCALPETQPEGAKAHGFFPQDCGAATQNILLQAAELGLGSCWCGVYPKEGYIANVREILGITALPFNIIAIGVPDDTPKARGFFEESKIRYID